LIVSWGKLMKITKKQLKQIIKEELANMYESNPDLKRSAELSAWILYAQDRAEKPDFSHPNGDGAAEAACKKRNNNRLAKGRDPELC
jgi:hypothetical protein